jgi:biotin---protein ligase
VWNLCKAYRLNYPYGDGNNRHKPCYGHPGKLQQCRSFDKGSKAVNPCAKSEEPLRVYFRKLRLKLEQKGRWRFTAISSTHFIKHRIDGSEAQIFVARSIIPRDQAECIGGMKDTFRIEAVTTERSVEMNEKSNESLVAFDESRGSDLSIFVHVQDHPTHEETPFFDHNEFFSGLRQRQSTSPQQLDGFGSYIIYGQVTISTNNTVERLYHCDGAGWGLLQCFGG